MHLKFIPTECQIAVPAAIACVSFLVYNRNGKNSKPMECNHLSYCTCNLHHESCSIWSPQEFPSVSSLKQFLSANNQSYGINSQHLQEARKSYATYIEERMEHGYPKSMHTGEVMFEVVKAVMKVHWNSVDNGWDKHSFCILYILYYLFVNKLYRP